MQFAVNTSRPLLALLKEESIAIDLVKCPAWPDLIGEALAVSPCYVHTPLTVGSGRGVIDSETGAPPDWEGKIRPVLALSNTGWVAAHFNPLLTDYPDMPPDSDHPRDIDEVIASGIADVREVLRHFPADQVLLENCPGHYGDIVRPGIMPAVISAIIEATGVGLLLDVSHARLASTRLGMNARDYISQLPVDRIGELHFAGIQRMEGELLEVFCQDDPGDVIRHEVAGRLQDHLPMTPEDFTFMAWVIENIREGSFSRPRVASFEYGAVNSAFERVTHRDVLLEQVPRLCRMIHPA